MFIDIPREWAVDELVFEDADGTAVDSYELERVEKTAGLYHPRSRNMPIYVNRFHLLLNVRDVPSLGYKTITVKYKEQPMYPYPHEGSDKVKIPFAPLASDARSAGNRFVQLHVADDGTLEIINKQTGRAYRKLNYFMDEGQDGNQQRCYSPKIDRVLTTLGRPADIALTINTDLLARFEIHTEMLLPKYFDPNLNRRSAATETVSIKSVVTLRKDDPVVEVETNVDNRVKDHFLRVCFESGVQAEATFSSEVFNTEVHPTVPSQDGKWKGPELRRHQQHLFMNINDGTDGLTILNDSLRDYEVINPETGLIAQSIVRSVELNIPCDNRYWLEFPGDDSTQSLGKHTTRYGILVHGGDWQEAEAYSRALAFNVPLRLAQISKQTGNLPLNKSFLELGSKQLVLSCVKKAQDRESMIVRFYNPTDAVIESDLVMGREITQVFIVNLNEERQEVLLSKLDAVKLTVPAKKIITIEIETK